MSNITIFKKQSSLFAMSLPVEILLKILSFLPNNSLKTLRLVSNGFYDVATPSLFSSVFVSARHLDREIADLVAARFSHTIRTLTFSSESYYSYYDTDCSGVVSHLRRKPRFCANAPLHWKKAKIFWKLYCNIGSERQKLHESGAVQAQLCHLLDTLPNLRQIIITDRRRRQDLSWLQEAKMGIAVQRLPPPQARIPLSSGVRRSLADLHRLRKEDISDNGYKSSLELFRSGLKGGDIEALAQLQTIQSVGCACFDQPKSEEPPYFGMYPGLGDAGTSWMPQNPWAVIMVALHKVSNASTHTIFIQPRCKESWLPMATLKDCDPGILLSTTSVLACLTKLELRLAHSRISKDTRLTREEKYPTKLLSGACNLRSLTIEATRNDNDKSWFGWEHGHDRLTTPVTDFGSLLAGCKLPHLSKLHLRDVTFVEEDFSVFLRYSPDLRDLSLKQSYMVVGWNWIEPPFPDPRAWERLLQTVKETLRHLENFDLSDRQLCKGEEEEYWYPPRWGAVRRRRGIIEGFDGMVQSFLFDEGTNPFASIVV